jgi:hypothetical protein
VLRGEHEAVADLLGVSTSGESGSTTPMKQTCGTPSRRRGCTAHEPVDLSSSSSLAHWMRK